MKIVIFLVILMKTKKTRALSAIGGMVPLGNLDKDIRDNVYRDNQIVKLDLNVSPQKPVVAYKKTYKANILKAPWDMHYPVHMSIVRSGQVELCFENFSRSYLPGQIIFTGIWEPHKALILKTPCRTINTAILPEFLANIRSEQSPQLNCLLPFIISPALRPHIAAGHRREYLDLAKRMIRVLKYPEPHRQLFLQNYVKEILLNVFMRWNPPQGELDITASSFMRINPVLHYLFDNPRYVTEKRAANICHMKLESFKQHFHKAMGITFARFSLQYRLNGFLKQLMQTDQSIKSIAYEWGFKYSSHLNIRFKEHFGCSPQEYLKQFKS